LNEIFVSHFPEPKSLSHLSTYTSLEEMFECSGMCRPALFYHSLPVSEGYPMQTCIQELKEFVDDGAVSFAQTSVVTGVLSLVLFLMHFRFYFIEPENTEEIRNP